MDNCCIHRKAALFDRDGTLIIDSEYISDPEEVVLIPGARACVQGLKKRGYIVGLVTNQSGIGRGFFSESDFWSVTGRLEELLSTQFDAVEMCPHHPDDQCRCRKPSPYMLQKILDDQGCAVEGSFYAGDKRSDIEAGNRSGLRTFWCSFGPLGESERADDIADITVTSLEEILDHV
jgi:D-glycero-D-manno-heptose 1,7-bisphosphate phosphatase